MSLLRKPVNFFITKHYYQFRCRSRWCLGWEKSLTLQVCTCTRSFARADDPKIARKPKNQFTRLHSETPYTIIHLVNTNRWPGWLERGSREGREGARGSCLDKPELTVKLTSLGTVQRIGLDFQPFEAIKKGRKLFLTPQYFRLELVSIEAFSCLFSYRFRAVKQEKSCSTVDWCIPSQQEHITWRMHLVQVDLYIRKCLATFCNFQNPFQMS